MDTVYLLFYNHDDDGNVESVEGVYKSLEGAKQAADKEHEYDSHKAALEWQDLDWDGEGVAIEAFRDRHEEQYFRIVSYGVEQ